MAERLRWGLIGGGEGSQIGEPHRIAARLDGLYDFVAGALDVDAERGRAFARALGVPSDRAYGDWREMLEAERARPDPVEVVTVATPNVTHYEIARAFLEAGMHVVCEKPMTMTEAEAESLVAVAEPADRRLVVNFGYSGYPMVREARARIARGDAGHVRLVVAEFAHGHHADAAEAENPRLRWRYDPAQTGVSSALADAGIHALHMVGFVTGQRIAALSAQFDSLVPGRKLEDNATVSLRYAGGTLARLWASAIAIGQMHGLNIRVFGEKAGLAWHQERPNQLLWTPVGGATTIVERGSPELSPEAAEAGRFAMGHPEGLPVAFANLYRDLHTAIRETDGARRDAAAARLPLGPQGAEMVAAVHAAAGSAAAGGTWMEMG
ncbi:MAG: Gfo/Idh/MocA family oxidoreductase [Azospirillaceae bacterium]